jgi:hypothetical protein
MAIAGPAMAASSVYRNIPLTLPGNVPSVGFEATSTAEFGDLIQFGAGTRASASLPVTVIMSSWACQHGGDATCVTTPGATWSQPLTLTIYSVDSSVTPPTTDKVLIKKTQSFAIPYRPSYDSAHCKAYQWYSAAEGLCYNGLAQPVTFTLPAGVTLPDRVIWSIAFNTENRGYAPTGHPGPYNSLNVGSFTSAQLAGTDVDPDAVFTYSTGDVGYGDGGPLNVFRDTTGWTGYAPMACFGSCPINLAAAPTEEVGGASGGPVTPPPTGTAAPSGDESSPSLVILISLACGALGLVAVRAVRREWRP